jgi:hypothetical protein
MSYSQFIAESSDARSGTRCAEGGTPRNGQEQIAQRGAEVQHFEQRSFIARRTVEASS